MIKRYFKLIAIACLTLLVMLLVLIFACSAWINYKANPYIYHQIEKIPATSYAVVLGTAQYYRNGGINLYFKQRMDTVKQLFDNKKIDFVIVSGDNRSMSYNETRDMRRYLTKLDIPPQRIVEDFAGFRTLDSVLRAKLVFGLNEFIIVSQKSHSKRAIFVARAHGINAIAITAGEKEQLSFKYLSREYLARVKAILDVYLFNTKPKFWQQPESIPDIKTIIEQTTTDKQITEQPEIHKPTNSNK